MAPSTIRITEVCQTKRELLSRSSATVLRFSRPETNEEVFQIFGSEENVVELVKTVARMLPHSINWEIENERLDTSDTHTGRWRCDLEPIGRVDENMVAHFNRDALEALGLITKGPEDGPLN